MPRPQEGGRYAPAAIALHRGFEVERPEGEERGGAVRAGGDDSARAGEGLGCRRQGLPEAGPTLDGSAAALCPQLPLAEGRAPVRKMLWLVLCCWNLAGCVSEEA